MVRIISLLFFLALLNSGCAEEDFYSQLSSTCHPVIVTRDIPEDCLTSVEATLPFDESFDSAPSGYKEEVIHAFAALAYFPIKLPENKGFFGVAPDSISTWQQRIVTTSDTPNRSLYNYVRNHIGKIFYVPRGTTEVTSAHYWIDLGLNGEVYFHKSFFAEPMFEQVATLVHESRHGDAVIHLPCPSGRGLNCDADLSGPYGFGALYGEMLLNGSGNRQTDGSASPLTDSDLSDIAESMCEILATESIILKPSDLESLLLFQPGAPKCILLDTTWVIGQEKLRR